MPDVTPTHELATEIIRRLIEAGETLAAAESLTGGLVAAALTDIPGASNAFRGGVIAYATELKAEVLGVDVDMLKRHGPVYAPVAAAMAEGVRKRLGSTFGVATTGVAGPGPQDGHQAGYFEKKFFGPERVLFDIAEHGWAGAEPLPAPMKDAAE